MAWPNIFGDAKFAKRLCIVMWQRHIDWTLTNVLSDE